jgi:hypothetical protein
LKLIPAIDQDKEKILLQDGTQIDTTTFHQIIEPLREFIRLDQAEIIKNPNGERAKLLDQANMDIYLQMLADHIEQQNQPKNLMEKLGDSMPWNNERMEKQQQLLTAIETIKGTFAPECGLPSNDISAFRFLHEFNGNSDSVIASDCGFRIEGGTEKLIEALHNDLKSKGVNFKLGNKLESITKTEHGNMLNFVANDETQTKFSKHADKTILAVAAHAIPKIGGLDSLGLSNEALNDFAELKYTDNIIKCTIKLRPDVHVDRSVTLSANGYQAWMPEDNLVTFFIHDDKSANPAQTIARVANEYAIADGGKNTTDIFMPLNGENVIFAEPKGEKVCYAAPSVSKYFKLMNNSTELDKLLANGIAVTGTFKPRFSETGIAEVGCMEGGALASKIAVEKLFDKNIAHANEHHQGADLTKHWTEFLAKKNNVAVLAKKNNVAVQEISTAHSR